ncbi:MAG: OprO/OprP family phosphate-selective porin [Gemmataceae bacterium]
MPARFIALCRLAVIILVIATCAYVSSIAKAQNDASLPTAPLSSSGEGSLPSAPVPVDGATAPLPPSGTPGSINLGEVKDGQLILPGGLIGAGWRNGFFIESLDQDFILRITGQIQADFRGYADNRDTTDISTFLLRRARLGVEADMFKYYEFRLLPDFGQVQPNIQDAYINVHYVDYFQVEAGKFKQPFSYEQLIQDRFVPTMERSMLDQVVPARDEGVMVHGQKLFDNHLDLAASVSNGEINGNSDTNGSKDLVGRIALRPFGDPDSLAWLQGFQLGVSGSVGKEQEPISPNAFRTPGQVRFFQFNSTVQANGTRTRYSPEVVYFFNAFGFAAQYLHMDQQMRPNSVGPGARLQIDVPTDSFYVMATLLLTGERRTAYSMPIDPLRPWDPKHPFAAPGAWELVARVSHLEEGGIVFTPGARNLADLSRFSPGATEMTLGFNWYLNRWVRTQFNWEHAWFNRPVQLGDGPGGRLRQQDTLLTRLQIIF